MKIFSDKISVFKNFKSEPKTITLGQWLKACKQGSRFTEQVLEYRRCLNELIDKGYSLDEVKEELEDNGKDQLKKSLPHATVGAVCAGGRKLENVISRTGWIALDIDYSDNPHLSDAEHLRDEVAKIANVAFAGLSTGGRGVWALVKVSQPERQAEHFESLQEDFKAFGITLDSSKGHNPHDARFYSYDPGAIIKDSFTVYKKLPPPRPAPQYRVPAGNSDRYGQAAFTNEIDTLSSTGQGNRNNQLFKSSAALASLVAGGVLDHHEVEQALFDAALSIGLKEHEIRRTIQSGFTAGFETPRTTPQAGHTPRATGSAPCGQTFDHRGYPEDWDEITPPAPGSVEDRECVRYLMADTEPDELHQLCKRDPMLKQIVETFDCEPQT